MSGGNLLAQGLAFVRIAILARLLSVEDFGIAATFLITVAFLGMLSDLGIDRLLIQAPKGGERRFQGTAHVVLAARGLALAAIIFLLAEPIGGLFKVPEAIWAFRWLAVVPLVRGFMHSDYRRLEREFRFRAAVLIDVCPQLLIALAVWPIAAWLGNYSAVLWLVIAHAMASVIGSHLVAERPYIWALDRMTMASILSFGWPLLINGLLMFGIFHGDRVIIGSWYSMTELGVYSVAFALLQAPKMLLTKGTSAVLLPLLSRAQDEPGIFEQRYRNGCMVLAVLSGLVAVVLAVSASPLIRLIYGEKYAAVGGFVVWLVLMQAIRLIRVGPTLAAMALGDTQNMMISNIWRTSTLLLAFVAGMMNSDLLWIAAAGCMGEMLALGYSLLRLSHRQHLEVGLALRPAIVAGAWMIIGTVVAAWIGPDAAWSIVVGAAAALSLGLSFSMLVFPEVRQQLTQAARSARSLLYSARRSRFAVDDLGSRP